MFIRAKAPLFCVLFAIVSWAQTPTAELAGTISDASGGIVSGVAVPVTKFNTNTQRMVSTNSADGLRSTRTDGRQHDLRSD